MNERNSIRYDAELLLEGMSDVMISWNSYDTVETKVVNCSSHGMRALFPPSLVSTDIPKKYDILKVHIPSFQLCLTGTCVYATEEFDGSISMGIQFIITNEQNYLHDTLIRSLKKPSLPCSFISYEWEELVEKLCNSEDPKLKEIGYQEMENLKHMELSIIFQSKKDSQLTH